MYEDLHIFWKMSGCSWAVLAVGGIAHCQVDVVPALWQDGGFILLESPYKLCMVILGCNATATAAHSPSSSRVQATLICPVGQEGTVLPRKLSVAKTAPYLKSLKAVEGWCTYSLDTIEMLAGLSR